MHFNVNMAHDPYNFKSFLSYKLLNALFALFHQSDAQAWINTINQNKSHLTGSGAAAAPFKKLFSLIIAFQPPAFEF
jgi:hypothetical protein